MREKDLVTRFLLGWTVEREFSLSRLDLILASSVVVKVLDGSIKVKQYQYIAWLHHWLVVASSALQRLSLSLSISLSHPPVHNNRDWQISHVSFNKRIGGGVVLIKAQCRQKGSSRETFNV